jgi:hypothetical protein
VGKTVLKMHQLLTHFKIINDEKFISILIGITFMELLVSFQGSLRRNLMIEVNDDGNRPGARMW